MPTGFTVVDLTPQCDVRTTVQYTYELLERVDGAADLIGFCSGQIWKAPEEFEVPLPRAIGSFILRWRSVARTAGILTVRNSQTDPHALSISLLASGVEPDADRLTLEAFQQHVVRELRNTGFEPAFDLLEVRQRPLVATVGLSTPANESDRWPFALVDRCFAASYFRRLGLV